MTLLALSELGLLSAIVGGAIGGALAALCLIVWKEIQGWRTR